MDRDEVRRCVLESLRFLLSDTDTPDLAISERSRPIPDLGMKSDDGVDFACEISSKIGFSIPDKVNPFINDAGNRARRVDEIINYIQGLVPTKETANA